jgi:hypothetical protein
VCDGCACIARSQAQLLASLVKVKPSTVKAEDELAEPDAKRRRTDDGAPSASTDDGGGGSGLAGLLGAEWALLSAEYAQQMGSLAFSAFLRVKHFPRLCR